MQTESLFPFQSLDVYVAAKELARRVCAARIADDELRDQATRAAKSCFLNLCEGLPADSPGLRRRAFAVANGSLHEVVAALDLAGCIGALAPSEAEAVQALGLRVKRMLRALSARAR
jgi:four helix bundle protein